MNHIVLRNIAKLQAKRSEIVPKVLAVGGHLAFAGTQHSREALDQRAFPGTRGSENGGDLPSSKTKAGAA